jgi:hypothetical protein
MKRSDLKELIKKSMLEVSPNSGAMTPEEEEMVAGYEEEEANKYALDNERPLEEALNKDIKAFGQDLDKAFKAAGFDTLVLMQTPSAEQMNIVKTNPKAALFEVSQTPEAQTLTVYVNPKQIQKAESIINKFQLSDFNGPVLKKGWTAKQVQGAINPGDIVKQDADKARGMWYFYRLAKVDTKVKSMEEALLAEDNLEVKSIAKQLYSWLKQNDVNTKLIAQTPSTSYGKQIGASLKGGSNEALISYYDDPKTKQTVIQVQLYGGPTSKDLVLQIEKKLLSSYPKLEQYDRQEIPTPQFFNLNFKVKEKTTAKGGLAGNTRLKQEPMEEASVILNRDEVYAKYAPLVKQYMASGLDKYAAISKAQNVLAKEYGATPLNIQSTISDYFDDQDRNATYANEDVLREADEIVAAYAEKKTLNEEMYGGYLELFEMNPNFEEGVSMLLAAWDEWKEGPMTEPYMVEEAKQDVLAYLSSMMK